MRVISITTRFYNNSLIEVANLFLFHELKKSLISILSALGSISNGIILRRMLVSHILLLKTLKPKRIRTATASVKIDTKIT